MKTGTKHFNIKVFGRVQKVGFRFNTKRKADRLNIKGFVKNKSDGSVYIEAEGDQESLEKFISWVKKGPLFSKVKRIEKEKDKVKNFEKFNIKY